MDPNELAKNAFKKRKTIVNCSIGSIGKIDEECSSSEKPQNDEKMMKKINNQLAEINKLVVLGQCNQVELLKNSIDDHEKFNEVVPLLINKFERVESKIDALSKNVDNLTRIIYSMMIERANNKSVSQENNHAVGLNNNEKSFQESTPEDDNEMVTKQNDNMIAD